MTALATSTVPPGYNLDFLSQQTGIPILITKVQNDGSTVITYNNPSGSDDARMNQAIADYPTKYLSVAFPLRLDDARTTRDQRISAFMFNGILIQLDSETKLNISAAMAGLQMNPNVTEIDWSLGNGQFVTLNRYALMALANAAFVHVQTCFTVYKAKVRQLQAAKDIFELAAIDLINGWPN